MLIHPLSGSSAAHQLVTQAVELCLVAPQVVAHRLARMVVAGPLPTTRGQQELLRMGEEKITAFQQSWAAMWVQALHLQLQVAQGLPRATAQSLSRGEPAWMPLLHATAHGTTSLLQAGLAPVHRRAVANARRLQRNRS